MPIKSLRLLGEALSTVTHNVGTIGYGRGVQNSDNTMFLEFWNMCWETDGRRALSLLPGGYKDTHCKYGQTSRGSHKEHQW